MSLALVTGGAGFIGSHLVERLVSKGHSVRVLDDFSSGKLENLAELDCGDLNSGKSVEIVRSCITDPGRVASAMQGADWVVHLAAQVSVPRSIEDPRESYRINVDGTLNIVDSARIAGVQRVVFAASSAAYGDNQEMPLREEFMPRPLSPYASGKLAGEQLMRVWAECYGMHTTSLRFFNVFGPRQADDSPYTGVIAIFAKALIEGRQPTIYGDGSQTRDFTFVSNVIDGICRALEGNTPPGSVINLGAGDRISLLELYRAMGKVLGKDGEPNFGPARDGDVPHSQAAPARAKELLGWTSKIPWAQGLEVTLEWYRQRLSAGRS